MSFLLIGVTALVASLLTFFSGFGLGTLLMPDLELAIGMTAVVNLLNNLFKIILIRRYINYQIVAWFGIAAAIGAFLGSQLLFIKGAEMVVGTYRLGDTTYQVHLIKIIVAILIITFAIMEMFPRLNFSMQKKQLPLGGLLSGFFGGLSGHQGAMRSAFLLKMGLSKESFIASGIVIACMIDVTRISVYSDKLSFSVLEPQIPLLICGTLCAFTGAFLGSRLLKKITISFLQKMVSFLIILFSFALALGWV